jgi:25S rRNA (cytosine2278-C5)-methyltransferase
VKTTQEDVLQTCLASYAPASTLSEVTTAKTGQPTVYKDEHVADLLAVPPDVDLTRSKAYLDGDIILQDKASCYPAELLISNSDAEVTDMLDGCAAPGNKTTHLASIQATRTASTRKRKSRIFACERDSKRSIILSRMVEKAAPGQVEVLAKQDFLALDPNDDRFANVTHMLLDPSCSGSGIIGRADVPELKLPKSTVRGPQRNAANSKKRKVEALKQEADLNEDDLAAEQPLSKAPKDPERLAKLAGLQSRIVEHAFQFPAATRITYSTCSVHTEENEAVVSRVLCSAAGKGNGWRVLRRDEQPPGLRSWPHRGNIVEAEGAKTTPAVSLSAEDLEACIRCYPDDEYGTMGFFVVCFARDINAVAEDSRFEEDEWNGFSDED